MKKQLLKAALLAALGMAGVTAAQAQSEMVLGFNDQNYFIPPAGSDYTIDLGSAANFTATYSGSWGISSSLFSSAFGADGNALYNVAAGVVGSTSSANIMQTIIGALNAPGTSAISGSSHVPATIPFGVNSYVTSPGWSASISGGPSIAPYAGTTYSSGVNPMGYLVSGTLTEVLYSDSVIGSGRTATTTGWQELGTFVIDAPTGGNDGTITFNGVNASVPEPATYGVLAGAGLLLLSLRRQFLSKTV